MSFKTSLLQTLKPRLDLFSFPIAKPGEPDWSIERKMALITRTLEEKPALFLEKWGHLLSLGELQAFRAASSSSPGENVEYMLDLLETAAVNNQRGGEENRVRNRRLRFLQQQLALPHSDYFCIEALRRRDPELYEEYVGQYLSEAEKLAPFDPEMTLVQRIYYNLDEMEARNEDLYDGVDDSDPEEEEEEEEGSNESHKEEVGKPQLNEEEKEGLLLDFVRIMQERFLDGRDKSMDYAQIDLDPRYDDEELLEREIHEHYFLSSPCNTSENTTESTADSTAESTVEKTKLYELMKSRLVEREEVDMNEYDY